MLLADDVAECPVLKEPELTAKEMIRWEAMKKKVTRFDKAKQQKTAELERAVEISEGQPAAPKTALRKNKNQEREEHGSGIESSGGTSSWKVSRLRVNMF